MKKEKVDSIYETKIDSAKRVLLNGLDVKIFQASAKELRNNIEKNPLKIRVIEDHFVETNLPKPEFGKEYNIRESVE